MNTLSVQDEFGVLHNESSRDVSRIQSIHPFTSDIDRESIYKTIHQWIYFCAGNWIIAIIILKRGKLNKKTRAAI